MPADRVLMWAACAWLGGLFASLAAPTALARFAALGALGLASAIAIGALALCTQARVRDAPAPTVMLTPWVAWALVLTSGLSGLGLAPLPTAVTPPLGTARLVLDVLETQRLEDGGSRAIARIVSGERLEDSAPLPAGALVRVTPATLTPGTRVRLLGQVSAASGFRNPTPHPRWPGRHALSARVWVRDERAIEVLDHSSPRATLERARQHVMQRLAATLPPRTTSLALALVLGEGDAIDEATQESVRLSGLAHVLAVSGMHVVLVVGALVWLLQAALLRVPFLAERYEVRRIASALGVPLSLAYAVFAGSAPSALRSATTASIAWGLIALGRRPSAMAVCACAMLVLGALDPREVLRPGFLLSVLATAAILVQPRPSSTPSGHLGLAARIALCTTLATAPIVLWCFGQLPAVSVLANLVLAPMGSLVLLPVASVHALLVSMGGSGSITGALLVLGCDAFVSGCELMAALSPAWVLPPLDVPQGIVLSAGVLGLFVARTLRTRTAVLLLATVALLGLELRLQAHERPRGVLRATFLDVGQGDAALIDLPDGRLLLVDAGGNPGGGPDPGRAVLEPLLAARRRTRIDIAVLSHPHPDHYGGLRALFDAGHPLGQLWDSGQAEAERELQETSGAAAEILAQARASGAQVRLPRDLCGAPLDAAGARVHVLSPCPAHDPGLDPNDNSLVLRIEYQGRSLLLMGDAEHETEAALLARGAIARADVLKVGHHGSRTSSTADFIAAAQPGVAIISAGANNRFGHPHAEVVERLSRGTPHVLNLAAFGGTVVTIEDGALTVAPYAAPEFQL